MRYIHLDGEVNEMFIDKFFQAFNQPLGADEEIIIYLDSPGGRLSYGEIILDVIDKYKDRITLIASGEIFSCAFNIFFFSNCKRKILTSAIGMAHYAWSIAPTDGESIKGDINKFVIQSMKEDKVLYIAKLKEKGLSRKELKQIEDGHDCFFTTERLQELLDRQQQQHG